MFSQLWYQTKPHSHSLPARLILPFLRTQDMMDISTQGISALTKVANELYHFFFASVAIFKTG